MKGETTTTRLPCAMKMKLSRSNYSENIERHRKIIQQRIVAVKEEASRKYGNLVGSIPLRLLKIVETKQEAVGLVEDED